MDEVQQAELESGDRRSGRVANVFETVLFQSRFLVLIAVLGSLLAALMIFLKGCLEIIQTGRTLAPQLLHMQQIGEDNKQPLIAVIHAIDYFLFAIVLLMFSMGAYELFISKMGNFVRRNNATGKLNPRPSWLNFKSVDDLEMRIGAIVMMILIVNLFEQSFNITYSKPSDLLYLGGALFLVAISLLTAHTLMNRVASPDRKPTLPDRNRPDGNREDGMPPANG